jgi:hypothetical protein
MGATGKVLDIEGDGEFAGRVAFDHLAGDMPRAVRGTHDMGAADPQLDLDRIAEKYCRLKSAIVSACQTFSGVDAM